MDEIVIRSTTTDDEGDIAALFAGLSSASTRLRFSHALGAQDIARYARIGPATTSVLALADGEVVGEARYELAEGGQPPELAVTVADRWQGHGLGRRLVDALRERAHDAGLLALRAVVRTDNRGMLHLLRTASTAVAAPVEDGEVIIDLATDDLMPPWPTTGGARTVLVETRSLADSPEVRALWEAGVEVRKCLGPSEEAHRACPALVHGACRLADEADAVVSLLPQDDATCRRITEDHAKHRGETLVARTPQEWRDVASRLAEGEG